MKNTDFTDAWLRWAISFVSMMNMKMINIEYTVDGLGWNVCDAFAYRTYGGRILRCLQHK